MPISGPSSYLPTTDEFIAHWNHANALLAPGSPIILANATSVSTLTSLRTTLEANRRTVEEARNALEGARADIELIKSRMLDRLNQFTGKIRSLASGTRWEPMLPKAFSITDGMGRVIPPLDEMADLWERYTEAVGPLTLRDGYPLGGFQETLAELKSCYTRWTTADVALGLARGLRNETQVMIYEILKHYRQRIPVEFAPGSAILETLPRLTPLPGSTPDAVTLAAAYNPETKKADLAWSEVLDKEVTELEIRATAGPEYDPEDETVVARFSPSDPREWTGTFGLLVPGSAATFKVYSITPEGNEHGSNAVTVIRPATG
ncbi:MAG TPA: hypothetical protein VM511_02345 [Luteolibacter sp.]|nr:hypothetical protein [Luteolibacter sp.]